MGRRDRRFAPRVPLPKSAARRRIEQDVDDEIMGHIELKARDLEREGVPADRAWAEAWDAFGRSTRVEAECATLQSQMARRRRTMMWWEEMKSDLAWGVRSLTRAPGFAAFATCTLALGIAANTSIFSVANGLFLRALPGISNPETLVEISRGPGFISVSYPIFEHFRDNAASLEDVAAFDVIGLAVGVDESPEVVMGLQVSGNYFDVLGTRPGVGRFFSQEEGTLPPSEPVVVLGHELWTRRFDSDPGVVGSTIRLNGQLTTVVGVTEEGFGGHVAVLQSAAFIPLGSPIPSAHQDALRSVTSGVLELIGRVPPRTDTRALANQLSQLARQRLSEESTIDANAPQYVAQVHRYAPLPGSVRGPAGAFVLILSVLVGLLLLISCVNVANLLLSRSATRRHEIAIRMSLGAGRRRLVRQLITESLLLALIAGGLGVLLAYWATSVLSAFQLPVAPIPGLRLDLHLTPNALVLGYSVALATTTGIIFGLVPALRATQGDLVTDLKNAGGPNTSSGGRLQGLLVGAQVAGTIVLLSGSGLFLRALVSAETLDPGFDTGDVFVAGFDLELTGRTNENSWPFYEEVLNRAGGLPGVRSVSAAGKLPLAGLSQTGPVNFDGTEPPEGRDGFVLANQSVGPGYFRTLGLSILEGRGIEDLDRADAPRVVVVNQHLADRFWPNERAVGKHLTAFASGSDVLEWEVVGVVETAKYSRLNEDPRIFAYFPASQRPRTDMIVHMKMAAGADPPIRALRAMAASLEPTAAVLSVGSLDAAVGIFMLPQRLGAWVGGLVGAFGLLLGGVGVYGITAFWVSQRTKEVGVRIALGAGSRKVVMAVMKRGMRAPMIGAGIGLALSMVASRFLEAFIFGVSPLDPVTFVGVISVLGATAVAANLVPALRAARVDPARTLRTD